MKTPYLKIKKGVSRRMAASANPPFDEWMAALDRRLWKYRGLSIYDLPDCQYRNWYDARLKPAFAINRALRNA